MHKFENIEEVIKHYNEVKGKNLLEIKNISEQLYPDINLTINKGIVGQIFEAFIGKKPNSSPNPDIEELDVELKVLPIRKIGIKPLQPKERSKIKSINYKTIINETWQTSEVKKKINDIIFFVYEHPTGFTYQDIEKFKFHGVLHYNLSNLTQDSIQIEIDWSIIKEKVQNEIAHELSEGNGLFLGASTSGTGKKVKYGKDSKSEAIQRSYSLKHSYLKYYYLNNKNKLQTVEKSIEDILIEIKNQIQNKSLFELSEKFNIDFNPKNKSAFKKLINNIFSVNNSKFIKEIEKENLTIKTIPIDSNGQPFEAMSFPKFSLVDLIYEDWNPDEEEIQESTFKNLISDGFIFISVEKVKTKSDNKYNDWKEWIVKDVFIWKPTSEVLDGIESEWKVNKKMIENNKLILTYKKHGGKVRTENNLPNQSETKFIHIRPHAKDSKDLDIPLKEKKGLEISWQSFWFNKDFTAEIIRLNRENAVV